MSKQVKKVTKAFPGGSKVTARTAGGKANASARIQRASKSKGSGATSPAAGKLAGLVALLRQPKGVTLQALIDQTGWQAHSVRGAISGAVKKKLGLSVESKRVDGERVYRIVG